MRRAIEGHVSFGSGIPLCVGQLLGGLDGIVAECGGKARGATCHVSIDEAWSERPPPSSEDEDALLDGAAAPRLPTGRRSCQIIAPADLDGLVVRLPDRQV